MKRQRTLVKRYGLIISLATLFVAFGVYSICYTFELSIAHFIAIFGIIYGSLFLLVKEVLKK